MSPTLNVLWAFLLSLNPKMQSPSRSPSSCAGGQRAPRKANPRGLRCPPQLRCLHRATKMLFRAQTGGPLLGRRRWALFFFPPPFKAQIAEIEEIPGQAERSFKQTLYNRL